MCTPQNVSVGKHCDNNINPANALQFVLTVTVEKESSSMRFDERLNQAIMIHSFD